MLDRIVIVSFEKVFQMTVFTHWQNIEKGK